MMWWSTKARHSQRQTRRSSELTMTRGFSGHRAGMRRRARSARRACHADRNAPNATPTSTATTANTPIEALAKDTASMNLFVSKGKQPSWK
jgi:hypothetical protein